MRSFFTRYLPFIQIIVFVFYVYIRIVTTLPALQAPRELADTEIYAAISERPILSSNFLHVNRPFVFPFLLRATGRDFEAAAMIQLGLTIVAWGLLAWAV